MFRLESERPTSSKVCVSPVNSANNLKSLQTLLKLFSACSGPRGHLHVIRSVNGGHVTLSSDCQRLLAAITFSRQLLKLIVSSVNGHTREHGDGGKYLACSCLKLIVSTVQNFEESTNYRVFCALYEKFAKTVTDYLVSEGCPAIVKPQLTDISVLLSYVKSLLCTRRLLNLTDNDCASVSELIVRTFLESVPEHDHIQKNFSHSEGIYFIGSVFQKHQRDSELVKGLFIECPALPAFKGEIPLVLTASDGYKQTFEANFKLPTSESVIKVALVTCSMSGDADEIISATFEVTASNASSVDLSVLEKWKELCKTLAEVNTGLLLCQKVIHPSLKVLLRSLGIMAVERLGSAIIPYVKDLTGAQPIVSVISVTCPGDMVGNVASVHHVLLSDKSYLHLQHPASSIVTLLLYARTEECLEEFKSCVKTALRGLKSSMKDGKFMAGAGCWQTCCSVILEKQVKGCLGTLANEVGCSESQVLSALSVFCTSVFHHWIKLLHVGYGGGVSDADDIKVDRLSGHCWKVKSLSSQEKQLCACGMKEGSTAMGTDDLHSCGDLLGEGTGIPFVKPESEKLSNYKGSENAVMDSSFHPDVSDDCSIPCQHAESSKWNILDNFSSVSQAFNKAVFTANLVLSLAQVISDSNF